MNRISLVALAVVVGINPFSHTYADLFGSGANSFNIEFVRIGSPNNPPDTTDRPVTDGAVSYEYRIGKYEISEDMINKANALGGLGITHDGRGANFPATSISWFEAAQFVNWLNTSTGSVPAYKFDDLGNFQLWDPMDAGYDANNLYRNSLAFYFLPSLDEWHKAAYYDPVAMSYYDYPTGSDAVPDGIDSIGDTIFDAVFDDGAFNPDPNEIMNVGLLSPYGTAGQGGNAAEWLEAAIDRANDFPNEGREFRGGAWNFGPSSMAASNDGVGLPPSTGLDWLGFRVATVVPEPCTILLFGVGIAIVIARRKR
jgi:formylglycine-generating enzyme required for sulfatase activity